MTLRDIYQNIFPEVTGKSWSDMSADTEAEDDITFQGFPGTEGKYSGKLAREVM
jgi:hypothetical protein